MICAMAADDGKMVQAVVLETPRYNAAARCWTLAWDCDVIEAIWVEFPEDYRPRAHNLVDAFGLCAAIEKASLRMDRECLATVTAFDLHAFGLPSANASLIELPLLPAGGLPAPPGQQRSTLALHISLAEPIDITVIVAKRHYDLGRPPSPLPLPVPMRLRHSIEQLLTRSETVVQLDGRFTLPVLQLAVAVVAPDGALHRPTRVVFMADGAPYELRRVDPRNPAPKGLHTYTFEPYGSPGRRGECRTTLDFGRLATKSVHIYTEGCPSGWGKVHVSALCETVYPEHR
jgi:hypothetical protein